MSSWELSNFSTYSSVRTLTGEVQIPSDGFEPVGICMRGLIIAPGASPSLLLLGFGFGNLPKVSILDTQLPLIFPDTA